MPPVDLTGDVTATAVVDGIPLVIPPGEVTLKSALQIGTATIPAGSSLVDVPISAVTDLSKALLNFTYVADQDDPAFTLVTGTFLSNTLLRFERAGAVGSAAVEVSWQVAEFSNGVSVQRGTAVFSGGLTTLNVGISAVGEVAVPFVCRRSPASDFGAGDFVRAELTDSTTLELRIGAANDGLTVEWQVAEFTEGANLVKVADTIPAGQTSTPTASFINALGVGALVTVSWALQGAPVNGVSDAAVAIAGNPPVFQRAGNGPAVDCILYAVDLYHGPLLAGAGAALGIGVSQTDVPFAFGASSLDAARSFLTYAYGVPLAINNETGDNLGSSLLKYEFLDPSTTRTSRLRTAGVAATVYGFNQFNVTTAPVDLSGSVDAASSVDGTPVIMPPGEVTLERAILRGTVTLASGVAQVDVTISTVDPSRSLLNFSYSCDQDDPKRTLVTGRMVDGSTLRFERGVGVGSNAVGIRWEVAEFSHGVIVERGTHSFTGGATSQSIPLPQYFFPAMPFVCRRSPSDDFGPGDFVRAEIGSVSGSNTLDLEIGAGNDGLTVEWQVAWFTEGVRVIKIESSIFAGDTQSLPQPLNDLIGIGLLATASWKVDGPLVNGLSDASVIMAGFPPALARYGNGPQLDGIIYVADLYNGPLSAGGASSFLATELQKDLPLGPLLTATALPVDSGRMFQTLAHGTAWARTQSLGDNLGETVFSYELLDATTARVTRAASTSQSDVSFGFTQFNIVPSAPLIPTKLGMLQSGAATLPAGADFVDMPIASVDPSKSVVTLTYSVNQDDPQFTALRYNLVGNNVVRVSRHSGIGGLAVDFRWQVVEFSQGITVQRGSATFMVGNAVSIPVEPVDITKSFPLISLSSPRTDWGREDHALAAQINLETNLPAPNALGVAIGGSNPGAMVEWQLLTVSAAVSRLNLAILNPGAASIIVPVSLSGPPRRFMLQYGAAAFGGTETLADLSLRGGFPDALTLEYDRSASGAGLQVIGHSVHFNDLTQTRLHQAVELATGVASVDIDLTALSPAQQAEGYGPVVPARTLVLLGEQNTGGKTAGTGDNAGVVRARAYLLDGDTLRIERDDTTADSAWYVTLLQFEAEAGPNVFLDGEVPATSNGISSLSTLPLYGIRLRSLQSRLLQLTGSSESENLSPPVDSARSILLFSYAENDDSPRRVQIRGSLEDSPSRVVFDRFQGGGINPDIYYQVAEFASGVSVQRGIAVILPGTSSVDVVLSEIDPARAIPIISVSSRNNSYTTFEWCRAEIIDSTTLRLVIGDPDPNNPGPDRELTIAWQVAEFGFGALVRTGQVTLGAGESTLTQEVVPFSQPGRLVFYSYYFVGADGVVSFTPNNFSIELRVSQAGAITAERRSTPGAPVEDVPEARIRWYIVELENGPRSDSTQLVLGPSVGQLTQLWDGLQNLNQLRTLLTGPYLGRGGSDSDATNDGPGGAWFRVQQPSDTTVQATRVLTGGTGSVFVVGTQFDLMTMLDGAAGAQSDVAGILKVLPAGEVRLRSAVYRDDTNIPASLEFIDAAFPLVDLGRSILLFSHSASESGPDKTQIRGTFTSGSSARFERATAGAAASIEYQIAQFAGSQTNGAFVQRGEETFGPADTVRDITLSTAVPLERSVPIVSVQSPSLQFGAGDWVRAELTSPTNLRLTIGVLNDGLKVSWQVVHFLEGAAVETGTISLAADEASTVQVGPPFIGGGRMLFYSYNLLGLVSDVSEGQIELKVSGTGLLSLEASRLITGPAPAAEIRWYFVEFPNGPISGQLELSYAGALQASGVWPNLLRLEPSQTVLCGPNMGKGGSAESSGQNPGAGWSRLTLQGTTGVLAERDAVSDNAFLFVIGTQFDFGEMLSGSILGDSNVRGRLTTQLDRARQAVERRRVEVVDIDLDTCANRYGIPPCKAGRKTSGFTVNIGADTVTLDTNASDINGAYTGMKAVLYDTQFVGNMGTVQGSTAATITFESGASSVDGAYDGMFVRLSDGQERLIEVYAGATRTASVTPDWDTVPAAGGVSYAILDPATRQERKIVAYDGGTHIATVTPGWDPPAPGAQFVYDVVDRPNACYNTFATCQDLPNYLRGVRTFRFVSQGAPLRPGPLPEIRPPDPAPRRIEFDSSSFAKGSDVTSLTWQHECAGQDRILLVGVSMDAGSFETPSGVTYAGRPLTKLRSDRSKGSLFSRRVRTELWYLVAPPLGQGDVVVTFAGRPDEAVAGSISLRNVDQVSPFVNNFGAGGRWNNPSLTFLPTTTGSWAVAVLAVDHGEGATADPGPTERWSEVEGNTYSGLTGVGATAGPLFDDIPATLAWTTPDTEPWAISAAELRAVTSETTIQAPPVEIAQLPYVMEAKDVPTEIDLQKGLGQRGIVDLKFRDEPDTDAVQDPYVEDRTSPAKGTFWTRLITRNPNYAGRSVRVRRGFALDLWDWNAFENQSFILENISGPDKSGVVKLAVKDIFKIADRNKIPTSTDGHLVRALPVRYETGFVRGPFSSTTIKLANTAPFDPTNQKNTKRIYSDQYAVIVTGAGFRQVRKIVDYDPALQVATVSPAWEQQLDTSSVYEIISLEILLPPGKGVDYQLYGTPGYVRIGDEVVGFEQIAYSTQRYVPDENGIVRKTTVDVLQIEVSPQTTDDIENRGLYGPRVFGTEPEDHSADTVVQVCRPYIDLEYDELIRTVMNDAQIDDTLIDLDGLKAEVLRALGPNYKITTVVPSPVPATDLLRELMGQVTAVMWWDPVSARIRFRIVQDVPPSEVAAFLTDATSFIDGSVDIAAKEDERLTRAAIFYDPIPVTGNLKETKTYLRGALFIDADRESAEFYGDVREDVRLSRWFTGQNASAVDEAVKRKLLFFKDTPRRLKFQIDAKDQTFGLADLVDVETRGLVEASGAPERTRVLVTKVQDEGGRLLIEGQTTPFGRRQGFIARNAAPDFPQDRAQAHIAADDGRMSDGSDPYKIV